MKKTIYLVLLLSFSLINAQVFGTDPEINISNISTENIWQITEMALNENEFSVGEFKPGEGILNSGWITWKALMISNRAHLHFLRHDETLTIRIANRAYQTNKGWSEAIGKLSKKKYKKYVQAIADKINEINKNPDLIRKAVKTSKLIPAFSAINKLGNTEWKLLKVNQTDNFRPILKFQVSNKGSKDVSLIYYNGQFEKISGVGTSRLKLKWEKYLEDNSKQTILKSNDSMDVYVNVGQGYSLETGIGFVMTLKFEYQEDKSSKRPLIIYNIPIPYKYQEGD